ncbi:MAG: 30S ribosomal protein S16 [Candidatus Moranbacteria bacterium RIFOXYA2_FULL_43_15]|nr:MAG: 30S ribosomal protein S16 [Candidatus Moranbacteria bacterium RIFOXYA2_FULL_43_15]
MLTIRFARVGKKNKAQFKIALQEHAVAPGGRHVEILGSYDPHSKNAVLKEDRIKYWLEKGAQASDTVYNLLASKGIISSKKRAVKIPAKKAEETPAETPKAEVKAEEKPIEEAKVEEKKVEEVKKEEAPTEEKPIEEK